MPSQFLTVALEAAKNAEEIITAYYTGDAMKVEMKADETPVTLADRGAEKVIRETIKQAFPDHGFLGEEYGIEEGDSPYVWIIDPIDATKNYIRKIPIFGTQIALMKGEELILGVSNAPLLNELLYAEIGQGAFLNGEPITVSSVTRPEDAMICHGGLKWFVEKGTFSGIYNLINGTLHAPEDSATSICITSWLLQERMQSLRQQLVFGISLPPPLSCGKPVGR